MAVARRCPLTRSAAGAASAAEPSCSARPWARPAPPERAASPARRSTRSPVTPWSPSPRSAGWRPDPGRAPAHPHQDAGRTGGRGGDGDAAHIGDPEDPVEPAGSSPTGRRPGPPARQPGPRAATDLVVAKGPEMAQDAPVGGNLRLAAQALGDVRGAPARRPLPRPRPGRQPAAAWRQSAVAQPNDLS